MPYFCVPKHTAGLAADFTSEAITSSSERAYLEYLKFQHKAESMVKTKNYNKAPMVPRSHVETRR